MPDDHDALEAARRSPVLAPLVDSLVVVSASRNGARLDAEVVCGDRGWWVVRVGEDEPLLFERPAVQAPVGDGGVAVVLNGLSSTGKSTVLRAVVDGAGVHEPWVGFDEPFFGHLAAGALIWPERNPSLWRGFLAGIAALTGAGNRVIAASGGLPHDDWRRALSGSRVLTVSLTCPPDVLAARHAERLDRRGDLIGSTTVHDGWAYDLTFDTAVVAVAEIAAEIRSAARVTGAA